MAIIGEEGDLLTITEDGYGERTSIKEYRKTHRESRGVGTIITNKQNGKVIFVREVEEDDEIMLTSKDGRVMRVPVKDIRRQGKNTMGLRMMRLNKGDKVVSLTKIVENAYEEATGS